MSQEKGSEEDYFAGLSNNDIFDEDVEKENNTGENNVNENNVNENNVNENNTNENNTDGNNTSRNNTAENTESDASEQSPSNSQTTGVQISSGEAQVQQDEAEEDAKEAGASEEEVKAAGEASLEESEDIGFSIGMRVETNSAKYGPLTGRIYYIDENSFLRIMPDGVSDQLYDFDFQDPDLGITQFDIVEKGPKVAFIRQEAYRVGEVIDAIGPDRSILGKYTITNINETNNKIIIEQEDTKDTIEIDFATSGVEGIPRSFPFVILRKALEESPYQEPTEEELLEQQDATLRAQTPGLDAAEALGEPTDWEDMEEFDIPQTQRVINILPKERIYSELVQKSDFLDSLRSLIPEIASQKNPQTLKKLRALVEVFSSLKNSIIKRRGDGSIEGEEKISLSTLDDVLMNRNVPIVRPVLDTKRVLVSEFIQETEQTEEQYITKRLDDLVEDSVTYLEKFGDIPAGEEGVGIPQWFQVLSSYFERYPIGDTYSNTGYSFSKDSDYFRHGIPGTPSLVGLPPVEFDKDAPKIVPSIASSVGVIQSSLRRAHGPTVRGLEKGGTEVIQRPDRASLQGYVLFPYRAVLSGLLGSTRTGTLWEDIIRSSSEKKWMTSILEHLGGIITEADSQRVLYLDTSDSTAIRISFSDYLKNILQTIIVRGPGDIASVKTDLGMEEMELNLEQQEIIQDRVKEIIKHLRTSIRQIRENPVTIQSSPNSIFDSEYLSILREKVSTQPDLDKLISTMASRTPNYKGIDIAVLSFLLIYAQDYTFASLSGNPSAIDRERIRYSRDYLLSALHSELNAILYRKSLGAPPQPNPCIHTKELNIIRKEKDDTIRMLLLNRFLKKRNSGGRQGNWMTCDLCSKELICHHEILQIQQFLHPREKQGIQKEIILQYAGGAFGKYHICRNCSIPISELEFDQGLEYDDNGRPMMGRSVLVDEDAKEEEELEEALEGPLETKEEISFNTALKTECYKIGRVICDRIGVHFEDDVFGRLVDRADAAIRQTIISREEYAKQDKKISYEVYSSTNKISLVAALVLIEVQSHVPDYIVRYIVEGCKPGFGGYPLIVDADPKNIEQSVGIQYMTCALVYMVRRDAPWSSGFQVYKRDSQRKEKLQEKIIDYIQFILSTDTTVQNQLEHKREYIKRLYGSGAARGRASQKIPDGFLPRMGTDEETTLNDASNATTPEGVHGSQGEIRLADAWIAGANRLAKSTAIIIQGSPYAETTCCPTSISEPGIFWKQATGLPTPPPMYNLKKPFARNSILYPAFKPRELIPNMATPSADLAYRVFLKVCFTGPRIGLSHEFGYDHVCDWCGIQVPPEYLYPDIFEDESGLKGERLRKEQEKRIAYEKKIESDILTLLNGKGVPLTEEGFQTLLHASHTRTLFDAYYSPAPIEPSELLLKLVSVDYEPVEGWKENVQKAMEALPILGPNATAIDIATALQPMRNGIEHHQELLKKRLGPGLYGLIESVLKENTETVVEILRSYFLIPVQRIINEYSMDQYMKVGKEMKRGTKKTKIAETHVEQLNTLLQDHAKYLIKYEGSILQTSFLAQAKLIYFVEQLRCILDMSSEFRISRIEYDERLTVPQKQAFLAEILRNTLIGPLGSLIDPDFTPDIEEEVDLTSERDEVHSKFRELLRDVLVQFKSEKQFYNPTHVREKIAEAAEAEKQGILNFMDKMSPERRKLELEKKKLGIGRWSVGGSKLIYSYDPEYWEKMRNERIDNYSLLFGPEGSNMPEGFMADEMGLPEFGEQGEMGNEGSAYEINFHSEGNDD